MRCYVFLSPSLQPVMVQAIERYMKQAIVDRNHAVASAALMSSFVSALLWFQVIFIKPQTSPPSSQ